MPLKGGLETFIGFPEALPGAAGGGGDKVLCHGEPDKQKGPCRVADARSAATGPLRSLSPAPCQPLAAVFTPKGSCQQESTECNTSVPEATSPRGTKKLEVPVSLLCSLGQWKPVTDGCGNRKEESLCPKMATSYIPELAAGSD